jgi:hypothetical protein
MDAGMYHTVHSMLGAVSCSIPTPCPPTVTIGGVASGAAASAAGAGVGAASAAAAAAAAASGAAASGVRGAGLGAAGVGAAGRAVHPTHLRTLSLPAPTARLMVVTDANDRPGCEFQLQVCIPLFQLGLGQGQG